MDLGATEWTAFRKVTFPMIAPGVAAAALLAAAISVDDYVITSFNAGQTQTFPLFIFGATRQGVPPEVNVLATALLIVVLVLMGLNVMLQRRLARRDAVRTEADAHSARSSGLPPTSGRERPVADESGGCPTVPAGPSLPCSRCSRRLPPCSSPWPAATWSWRPPSCTSASSRSRRPSPPSPPPR